MNNPTSIETWREAEGLLRRAQRILAITHVNPDGDAIGSLLGFTLAMRQLGKEVSPTCQDSAPQRNNYIAGFPDIRNEGRGTYDLIVSIDASDLQRLGDVYKPAQHARTPMLVFDHHITNTEFGAVNVVEPETSSSAEIILKLIQRMNIRLTGDIATALLTGLITDTLAFRTSNTSADTLAAATTLMRAGANMLEITQRALVIKPFESIRFMAAGVLQAKVEDEVIWATLPRKMRSEVGYHEPRGDAGLVSMLASAQEARIAVVFVENADGNVEIGFRAQPGYDVSQVAMEFGGGGHPAAAGCTLPGPMRDAVNRVLPRVKRAIRER
ncbi:MAG: bifunctional oligoribonuclease/PAP phosphatase NrnA [Thermoflexales bacterium]|nr:bifunctional oligoribonuclease/PAP phosphatase NrnA [Thermoflexales bacterium]